MLTQNQKNEKNIEEGMWLCATFLLSMLSLFCDEDKIIKYNSNNNNKQRALKVQVALYMYI
jgi:hypothetical protein